MKLLITALMIMASGAIACAQDFGPETYDYQIKWKWGLIDMTAAHAHVNVQCSNGEFFGTLGGHSIDWEGRVYTVADTLQATTNPDAESIKYINGWYTKPRNGQGIDLSDPSNYRTVLGQGTLSASPSTMEAVEITANMLSMYFYARSLDFENMEPGHEVTIPIAHPDGSADSLTITYNGTGTSLSGSCPGEVYNVVFNYSYHGTPSAYPVQCEIAKESLIPIYFSANIKIGHVAMAVQ